MALYHKAWFEAQIGDEQASAKTLKEAAAACPDYCFPNQNEAAIVLEWAKNQNPADPKAPYYLGNLWYNAHQHNEALSNWELSVSIDDNFPTVHRNLALVWFNKKNSAEKALTELEKAFALNSSDARIFMELDQLYKRLQYLPEFRLQKFEQYPELVDSRDDLYLEKLIMLNVLRQFEEAYSLIMKRKFHPWEGGEGKVTGQYVHCLTEMAKKAIDSKEYEKAIGFLNKAQYYPDNLGEGKLYGAQENAIFYWLGCAFDGLGICREAVEWWQKAAEGMKEPASAIFYNDQQPDTIFYQGLALIKLGKIQDAGERFETLIRFGELHLNDEFKLDYFAVSLPDLQIWDDDLTKLNIRNCQELIRMGEMGLLHL